MVRLGLGLGLGLELVIGLWLGLWFAWASNRVYGPGLGLDFRPLQGPIVQSEKTRRS